MHHLPKDFADDSYANGIKNSDLIRASLKLDYNGR